MMKTLFEEKIDEKMDRRERKKLQNRIVILKAAKKTFETYPYEEIKIEDISDEADVSRATVYNYFKSKEEILLEIGRYLLKSLCKEEEKLLLTEDTGLTKVLALCKHLIEVSFSEVLIHQASQKYFELNLVAEVPIHKLIPKIEQLTFLEKTMAEYLLQLRELTTIWSKAINEGSKDGSIKHSLKPAQLAHYLFALIAGIHDRYRLQRIGMEKNQINAPLLTETTLEVIRKAIH